MAFRPLGALVVPLGVPLLTVISDDLKRDGIQLYWLFLHCLMPLVLQARCPRVYQCVLWPMEQMEIICYTQS